MGKIGIVFCGDIDRCPYLSKYVSVLEEKSIAYDVISWDREGRNIGYPSNYLFYQERNNPDQPKRKKLWGFLRFGRFLNRTIKENHYDKLIMLTTLPAILTYGLLKRRYRNSYIFDFRDLGLEKNKIFLHFVKSVCDNSYFTCISSPGFEEILGNKQFIMAHNFRYADLKNKVTSTNENPTIINLLHIGMSRGEEYNKALVRIFGNDDRFVVNIVGVGNDTPEFLEYSKSFPNIRVVGAYQNSDKLKYIEDSTMLLYYYPCDFNCDRALANKYYDGIIYKKPMIGNIDTYSGKRIVEKGLGISLQLDDSRFADKIYEYITSLNYEQYNTMAEQELEQVLCDDVLYLSKIEDFLMQ